MRNLLTDHSLFRFEQTLLIRYSNDFEFRKLSIAKRNLKFFLKKIKTSYHTYFEIFVRLSSNILKPLYQKTEFSSYDMTSKSKLTRLINWYPPYIGAGIKMTYLSKDFKKCKVRMKLRWWNKNVVGTHFGGSLYAMVDPFYVLMLMRILNIKEYIIWDKAATIHFRKPGKSTVFATFEISDAQINHIKKVVDENGKSDFTFHVNVVDPEGITIAEVEKVIYVRKKNRDVTQAAPERKILK